MARRFDYTPRFDARSVMYRLSNHLDTSHALRTRNWNKKVVLDQGDIGACTGFGTADMLATTPRVRPGVDYALGMMLYHEAQKYDEWPGESYEGSSVLGAMKAASALGYVKSYYWCMSMEEILSALSHHGPVVIGVTWKRGMMNPSAQGMIRETGSDVGGHCVSLGGIDVERKYVRVDNSWGEGWGVNGSAWMTWDDLNLLRPGAEFSLALKPTWLQTMLRGRA